MTGPHAPMTEDAALARLAAAYGILPAYHDIDGREHHTSDATRRALLAAIGVSADDDATVREALREWDAERSRRILPAAVVLRDGGGPLEVRVLLPERFAHAMIGWRITREDGQVVEGDVPAGLSAPDRTEHEHGVHQRWILPLPALPHGYHHLALSADSAPIAETRLIVAPASCYWPPAIEQGRRLWGPAVQLYSVRSRRNWGIGDFTDLAALVDQWGSRGAAVVGFNPLHALFVGNPAHASPYSPSSRLFLNALYLDPEAVPDFFEGRGSARARRKQRLPAAARCTAQRRSRGLSGRCAGKARGARAAVRELPGTSPRARHRTSGCVPRVPAGGGPACCGSTRCTKRWRSTFVASTLRSAAGKSGRSPSAIPSIRRSRASSASIPSASSSSSICSGTWPSSSQRRANER